MEKLFDNPVKAYLPTLRIEYNRNKCHLNFSKRNRWLTEKESIRKEWEGGKDLQNLGREVGIMETTKTKDKCFSSTFCPFFLDCHL